MAQALRRKWLEQFHKVVIKRIDPEFKIYKKIERPTTAVDRITALRLLQNYRKSKDLVNGMKLESRMISGGLDSVCLLGDHLIRLFASCGNLVEANRAFVKVSKPSVYSWSAIISANAKLGQGQEAVGLYRELQQVSFDCNGHIYIPILKACTETLDFFQGRLVHNELIENQLEYDIVIGTTLVDMYAKCGHLEEAFKAFGKLPNKNVVSWGAMITGYAQHRYGFAALELFKEMQQNHIDPDRATFLSILKACSSIGDVEYGRLIHDQIIKIELQSNVLVGSTLVDMYVKCGNLEEAHRVFDNLPEKNAVTWNAMISGCTQHGHNLLALELFEKMQHEGVKPGKVTFLGILKACASIGAIDLGRLVHEQIIKYSFDYDILIGSTLVDMYAKCGNLLAAQNVFEKLQRPDVVSWCALIAGYSRCGNAVLACHCFEDMQQRGIKPNDVIFTNVLAACSHAGLVDRGCQYFKSMSKDHRIAPSNSHYNCMVDLLGRAGCLNEAAYFLNSIQTDFIAWVSLLTACRTYGNVELGRQCFNVVIQMEPQHAAAYIIMSNIYADAQMWEDVAKIEELRKCVGAWKKPAKAWIEINNAVHEFVVGDRSHPQFDDIYFALNILTRKMEGQGYTPQLSLVLPQTSKRAMENALCGHCEKLAIAFGIASTPGGTTIRVTKNLRVCSDCHSAAKIITTVERREIIISDAYRIHHFKEGNCSCGDYY